MLAFVEREVHQVKVLFADKEQQLQAELRERSGMLERIGPHNVFDGLDEALAALRERHRVPADEAADEAALRPPAAPADPR